MIPWQLRPGLLPQVAALHVGGGGGGVVGEFAYVTTPADDTSSQTTYSFASVSLGAAHADRINVAVVYWGQVAADHTLLSASIGGVPATIIRQQHSASGGIALVMAAVPTGTTGTVSYTMSGNGTRGRVSIFRMIPASGSTPLDSGQNISTSPALVANVEVAANGFLICAGFVGNTNTLTPSYNGVDTPSINNAGISESAQYVSVWSCATTENDATRDPGFTLPSGSGHVVAASWV